MRYLRLMSLTAAQSLYYLWRAAFSDIEEVRT